MAQDNERGIVPAEDLAWRVIAGEARIITVHDSRLHHLDPVATFLWERLQAGARRPGELVEALVAEFEVDAARARSDIDEFLLKLVALGLIRYTDEANG